MVPLGRLQEVFGVVIPVRLITGKLLSTVNVPDVMQVKPNVAVTNKCQKEYYSGPL
jgi:hypothetical protein